MNEIKIISSNIRFSNPNDLEHDWPFRKRSLGKIINDYSPQIVASQEGRIDQIKEFESLLDDLELIDSHREWITERMYPCLYFNKKIFDLLDSGDIWLSETPYTAGSKSFESAFPRLCTWAHLSHKILKKSFMILNLHLDHLETSIRLKQIKVLLNEINLINSNDLPLIICGDFNEAPHDLVHKEILTTIPKMIDPWIHLNLKEESSHHKFNDDLKSGKRIDWILLNQEHFNISEIFLDKSKAYNLFPSDHFVLKSKIILK